LFPAKLVGLVEKGTDMKTSILFKLFAIALTLTTLLIAIAPVEAAAPSAAALPSFEKFVKSVTNGQAGVIRGVYVPGVLALRVLQQPAGQPGYVSGKAGVATQFQMAADNGITGLLAHNYAAGKSFFNLAGGQEVRVVYGDGSVKTYIISAIYQYQALEPTNPAGDLVDLSNGAQVSAADVFYGIYSGDDHLTFQTCIAKDGNASWGRMFIVATPAP
jgi:hypothetical protein